MIVNVASTLPSSDGKKSCTDLAACALVKAAASLGLSAGVPSAVDVNVPSARLISNALLPFAGGSGAL